MTSVSVIDPARHLTTLSNLWSVSRLASYYELPTEEAPCGPGRLYLPKHQRLWSWKNKKGLAKQRGFIDSVLHNYPIPAIILNRIDDGSRERWQIYDGRHRVETLRRYKNNEFSLTVGETEVFYKDLNSSDRSRFDERNIPTIIMDSATPSQLAEVFMRLNAGKALSQADYCHANQDTELVSGTRRVLEANKERFRSLFGGSDITRRDSMPDWVGLCLGLSTQNAGNMTTSFERLQAYLDHELDLDRVNAGFDALFNLYTDVGTMTTTLPRDLKRYERVGFINAFFLAEWFKDQDAAISNWTTVITHIRTTGDRSMVTIAGAQNLTTAKIEAVMSKVHGWLAGDFTFEDMSDDSEIDEES
jgi:hypothetical protein